MGNLLASAKGEGHKEITTTWILLLVMSLGAAVLCFFLANKLGYEEKYIRNNPYINIPGITSTTTLVKNNMYYYCIAAAVFLFVFAIGWRYVYVYENCIKGSSVLSEFPASFLAIDLNEFQLNYDQVSSVDIVDGTKLVINAISVKHKIYAMNAEEVRDTILSQKNAVNQAAK